MNFLASNIPPEMKSLRQWVGYKAIPNPRHMGKVMLNPLTGEFARNNDPSTWTDFDSAYKYALKNGLDGLAFVLTDDITFIDLDECVHDRKVSEFARNILNSVPDTYAELSVSGRGIHIFAKGKLPIGSLKRNDQLGLEVYDTKRFCCMTGKILNHREKKLLDKTGEIANICGLYLPKREIYRPKVPLPLASLSDQKIVEMMVSSRGGARWQSLMNGDISSYPSHSNADMALACKLAFYTDDSSQIDRIFRSSGLYREKWDSYRGDQTYGQITINSALRSIKRNPMEVS